MPSNAIPQGVLSLDGADKKLEDKIPMAYTEKDLGGNPNDIVCFGLR